MPPTRLLPLLVALVLVACGPATPIARPAPSPTRATQDASPAAATPTTSAAPSATAPPPASSTLPPEAIPSATEGVAALPAPTLFDSAWDDRAPYQANLRPAEQAILGAMAGASVYYLDVTIADDYRQLTLQQEVRYTNQEEVALDRLPFRLYPNLLGGAVEVAAVRVNGEPVEPAYELEETALWVELPAPLEPGAGVVIALELTVQVPDSTDRNYGSFIMRNDVLALAHFYPLIAVYDDEGWNVEIPAAGGDIIYADSSFYRVRVTAPTEAVVVASGVQTEEEEAGGMTVRTFAAGPVRDFYLAASPLYQELTAQAGEIQVRSYAFLDQQEAAQVVLDTAVRALEDFGTRIGAYPFIEFDVIQTPNLALGIEYPGVVAITDRLYDLSGAARNGAAISDVLESTVVHEVGHQWFYSTIGNDQLDEPWLDESLVQYETWRFYVDQYGPEAAEGFYSSLEGRWDSMGRPEVPIGLAVGDYTDAEYSAIVYGRGPLFFEALAEEIGQETWDETVRLYYRRFGFGVATGNALKALTEEQCACDLTPLWEEWVEPQ